MKLLFRTVILCMALFAFAPGYAAAHDTTTLWPSSIEEAERMAVEAGLGESCGSRCWNCKPGSCPQGDCYCPFSECLENCAGGKGNHPVCCHGCCYGDEAKDRDAQAQAMADRMGLPVDWQPPSEAVAQAVADYLGLGESCGNRCWDCTSGGCGGKQPCPFFSCTLNCSAGHHPVCCYGCDGAECPSPTAKE